MALIYIEDREVSDAQEALREAGVDFSFAGENLRDQMMLEDIVKNFDRITPEKMDAFIKSL